ncbi:hypothetical protein SAMN04515647_0656 [Cohaesibacter sp. ES.047]|nr:hypothetical protein SAMN04515647_0656 [Cohaesibacter sp. ES.047]
MRHLHFSSLHASEALFRQTPNNDGQWQDLRVTLEDPDQTADWLVVYDRHSEPLNTCVPVERRILMVSEPPEFQAYPKAYLDQFGILLSPYPIPAFKGRQIIGHTALPWFYGMNVGGGGEQFVRKLWPDLIGPTPPMENRPLELTAVCSTKTQTKNQVRRLRFLDILKDMLGDRLTIYGRGFERLDDKADVINKSRYHLALENNLAAHGWTEKTADPILGGAFLIHGGSAAIKADFDEDGLLFIDLCRPHEAAQKVKACLDADPAATDKAKVAMAANKAWLMEEHNLFALLNRHVEALAPERDASPQLEQPEPVKWYGKSAAKRLFKLPRPLRRAFWKASINLFERT